MGQAAPVCMSPGVVQHAGRVGLEVPRSHRSHPPRRAITHSRSRSPSCPNRRPGRSTRRRPRRSPRCPRRRSCPAGTRGSRRTRAPASRPARPGSCRIRASSSPRPSELHSASVGPSTGASATPRADSPPPVGAMRNMASPAAARILLRQSPWWRRCPACTPCSSSPDRTPRHCSAPPSSKSQAPEAPPTTRPAAPTAVVTMPTVRSALPFDAGGAGSVQARARPGIGDGAGRGTTALGGGP